RSSWRGTPRTKWPEQLADGPLTLQYSPSSRTSRRGRVVPRAVVSRCSNVKPKLLDYLVGNGLMLPGFADTAAFDATLVNLGFGPQLRPHQVRPPRRAVSSVPGLPLWSRQAAFAEELARGGMDRLLFRRLPVRRKPARHEVARERFPRPQATRSPCLISTVPLSTPRRLPPPSPLPTPPIPPRPSPPSL